MPAALFLDFDGTLVEFAHHPDAITVPQGLTDTLLALQTDCNGAVAIVSGREIESVDKHLQMPTLAAAGAHGLMRRRAGGEIEAAKIDAQAIAEITAELDQFATFQDGLLVERKRHSVALHYRNAPHMEAQVIAAMRGIISAQDGFHMMPGKMLVEARSVEAGKGAAISGFMAEPPFHGLRPVFAGDDVTDEDGFETTNALGGITIKIGDGPSVAQHRIASPVAFRAWLGEYTTRSGADRSKAGCL
jgi:trehalose 6-phosphate phosphatase